jgi:hypothetical protein
MRIFDAHHILATLSSHNPLPNGNTRRNIWVGVSRSHSFNFNRLEIWNVLELRVVRTCWGRKKGRNTIAKVMMTTMAKEARRVIFGRVRRGKDRERR